MKKPVKALPKKRNLAAKALRDPAFRPKVVPDPKTYKRVRKIQIPPDEDDQIN